LTPAFALRPKLPNLEDGAEEEEGKLEEEEGKLEEEKELEDGKLEEETELEDGAELDLVEVQIVSYLPSSTVLHTWL